MMMEDERQTINGEPQVEDNFWSRLFPRRASHTDTPQLAAHLQTVEQQLQTVQSTIDDLARRLQSNNQYPAIHETLAALEKQVNKAGREQFKANTLAETQVTQLTAALEALRAADERREAELATLKEQSRAAQIAARLEVARAILPALDGLDEAIRAGKKLLETDNRQLQETDNRQQAVDDGQLMIDNRQRTAHAEPQTFGSWLRGLLGPAPANVPAQLDVVQTVLQQPEVKQVDTLRESFGAWVNGLTYIRQRLLDVLATENVRPIDVEGQPFDPQRHVAIEVVPADDATQPGTVAAEIRRGYVLGQRVLRHAEVAVAADEQRRINDQQ